VPGIDFLLLELSALGLPIKLDTNGLRPETVRKLLEQDLVQAVAVDVKGPWPKYPRLTGDQCSPDQAQRALEAIFGLAQKTPERFFFRCTAVPELSPDDLEETKGLVPTGCPLSIQTYIPPEKSGAY
jgi:pyruvate formate lyase activating enzyme